MDGNPGRLESLLLELEAQLLAGHNRVQDALVELHGGRAPPSGTSRNAHACAGACDDGVCAVGAEDPAARLPTSSGCVARQTPGEVRLQRHTTGRTTVTDEYDVLYTPQNSVAVQVASHTGCGIAGPGAQSTSVASHGAEVVMQSDVAARAEVVPAGAASQTADTTTQSPRDYSQAVAVVRSGAPRLLRAASRASSSMLSRLFSSSSMTGGQMSMAPQRSAREATGAMEMISRDSVRSYDLRDLWRRALPSEASDVESIGRRRFAKMFSITTSRSEPSRLRRSTKAFVQTTFYELTVIFLIGLNSLFLGWQVEYEANNRRPLPHNTEFEAVFCVVFASELGIKLYAFGVEFLFGAERGWNVFDMLVVVLMVADFVIQRVKHAQDMSGIWSQASVLRILRAVRVVRFLKAVRVLRMFSQLRIMIRSIMYSIRPLLWASLVLTAMFYVFAICITQGVIDYFKESDAWDDKAYAGLRDSFGTLERSVLSLFKSMSGGVEWGELFDTLSPLPFQFQAIFIFFVLFALFGAANVVTGIFVEIANHWARYDSHTQVQAEMENKVFYLRSLRELFAELDEAGSGTLTLDKMQELIHDQRLVHSFHALHIELMDVRTLFLLLDRDRKGYIDTEEFLLGCFRLKGEAKTLDIMKLQYQSEWLMHNLVRVCDVMDSMNVKVTEMGNQFSRTFPTASGPISPDDGMMAARRRSLFRGLSAQSAHEQWERVVGSNSGRTNPEDADAPWISL